MVSQFYPEVLNTLIQKLKKIPGIGGKNAERVAFFLLFSSEEDVKDLTEAFHGIKRELTYCSECFTLRSVDVACKICSDPSRDRSMICVVEQFKDVFLFEETMAYRGLYHVLEGRLAPLDGFTPSTLRIKELVHRVSLGEVKEIILATGLDTQGDATAFYISRLLKSYPVQISRLAKGLPVGSELEYADALSLANSLKNREKFL